jgi:hypothetical protein
MDQCHHPSDSCKLNILRKLGEELEEIENSSHWGKKKKKITGILVPQVVCLTKKLPVF